MAKRLIDDSLFSSPSLAACSPRAQDAFHRFLLLADDFGCFAVNPRVIVGRAWPLRQEVTEQDVIGWLREYESAGMLQLWVDGERFFAFFRNFFGPHGQKRRPEYSDKCKKGSKRRTPEPPAEASILNALLPGEFPPVSRQLPGSLSGSQLQAQVKAQVQAQAQVQVQGAENAPVGAGGEVFLPALTVVGANPSGPQISTQRATEPAFKVEGATLLERLELAYQERHEKRPRWGFPEEKLLRGLFDRGESPEEIERRWRIGLWWSGFPSCRRVRDLVEFWDHYVAPQEPKAGAPREALSVGAQQRNVAACALCGAPAESRIWEQPLCARHGAEAVESDPKSSADVAAWIQKRREAA